MPQVFKDGAGRSWEVAIDVQQIKAVKRALNLNLYALIDDGARPLTELLADPCQLVDVLYVLCKAQADQRGMTDEDFGRMFSGDTLEAASLCFQESLADFIPNPRVRKGLRDVMAKGRQVGSRIIDRAEKKIAALDVDREADSLAAKLSARYGSTPVNSASTPAP